MTGMATVPVCSRTLCLCYKLVGHCAECGLPVCEEHSTGKCYDHRESGRFALEVPAIKREVSV